MEVVIIENELGFTVYDRETMNGIDVFEKNADGVEKLTEFIKSQLTKCIKKGKKTDVLPLNLWKEWR